MYSFSEFLGIFLKRFLTKISFLNRIILVFSGVLYSKSGQKWVKLIDCSLCLEYLLTSKDLGNLDNCILTFKYSTGAYFGKMVINVMTVSEQWEKGFSFFFNFYLLVDEPKMIICVLKSYCLESSCSISL